LKRSPDRLLYSRCLNSALTSHKSEPNLTFFDKRQCPTREQNKHTNRRGRTVCIERPGDISDGHNFCFSSFSQQVCLESRVTWRQGSSKDGRSRWHQPCVNRNAKRDDDPVEAMYDAVGRDDGVRQGDRKPVHLHANKQIFQVGTHATVSPKVRRTCLEDGTHLLVERTSAFHHRT
jgi:hypothetical protein